MFDDDVRLFVSCPFITIIKKCQQIYKDVSSVSFLVDLRSMALGRFKFQDKVLEGDLPDLSVRESVNILAQVGNTLEFCRSQKISVDWSLFDFSGEKEIFKLQGIPLLEKHEDLLNEDPSKWVCMQLTRKVYEASKGLLKNLCKHSHCLNLVEGKNINAQVLMWLSYLVKRSLDENRIFVIVSGTWDYLSFFSDQRVLQYQVQRRLRTSLGDQKVSLYNKNSIQEKIVKRYNVDDLRDLDLLFNFESFFHALCGFKNTIPPIIKRVGFKKWVNNLRDTLEQFSSKHDLYFDLIKGNIVKNTLESKGVDITELIRRIVVLDDEIMSRVLLDYLSQIDSRFLKFRSCVDDITISLKEYLSQGVQNVLKENASIISSLPRKEKLSDRNVSDFLNWIQTKLDESNLSCIRNIF
jgi:hypothetical protein